jgi:tRNA-dihydrouridine synthase B
MGHSTSGHGGALPHAYRVGALVVSPNIVLAPMAGVTDTTFRRLVLGLGGCGLVCSEMTNAASVSPKALKRHKLLDYMPDERPIAMQISGNDADLMARAAEEVVELGADMLDINCGCPSPKVTGGGHGASLLRDLPKLSRILDVVRRTVALPLTLKYRAGWDDASLNYIEVAQRAEAAGVDALTLHPRTREQRYGGAADWERIAEVKARVGIPVVGSGDVRCAADALERMARYGVDGVMIGRAALANPWIFLQTAQLRRGEAVFTPTPADKHALMLRYVAMCQTDLPERVALNRLKQFIGNFVIELPGSAALRASVHRSTSLEEAVGLLGAFFERYGVGEEVRIS